MIIWNIYFIITISANISLFTRSGIEILILENKMARGTLFLRYIIIGFYAYTWYEHLKVLDQPGLPDEINFHKLWFPR